MTVALAILAAYRLAILVTQERGPFDMALLLRSTLARVVDYDSKHWLYEGVTCPWCVSFWAALLCWVLATHAGWQGLVFVGWWGVAGGVLVIDQLVSVQQDTARAAEEEAKS